MGGGVVNFVGFFYVSKGSFLVLIFNGRTPARIHFQEEWPLLA